MNSLAWTSISVKKTFENAIILLKVKRKIIGILKLYLRTLKIEHHSFIKVRLD